MFIIFIVKQHSSYTISLYLVCSVKIPISFVASDILIFPFLSKSDAINCSLVNGLPVSSTICPIIFVASDMLNFPSQVVSPYIIMAYSFSSIFILSPLTNTFDKSSVCAL